MFDKLLSSDVQQFIQKNADADVTTLLLKNNVVNGVAMRELVEQIISRKKAKTKTPFLFHQKGVVFPPKLSMEQCSSEHTALYKSKIAEGEKGADLTGGAGIDTYFLGKNFERFNYVEQNEYLANIATHNFKTLGVTNTTTHVCTAEEYLSKPTTDYDFIFIDPSRRDLDKNRVFLFSDCSPNIILLKSKLLEKAKKVMVKASPWVDIKQSNDELGNVEAIHVVAVENECKELLFILSSKSVGSPKMICSNYKGIEGWKYFEYNLQEEEESESVFSLPQNYLYEPNASIMKAGGFKVIGEKFGITKLHPNSHLYTSEKIVKNFPGRIFKISQTLKYDSKSLLKSIPDKKANITCRNFPESVQQIRKKTKIKEGGDVYVFATTTMDNKKTILLTEKVVSHD